MAATVTGSKTVTQPAAPHLPASLLTTLLATPIENLTVTQFTQINDALKRIPGGHAPTRTIGSILV